MSEVEALGTIPLFDGLTEAQVGELLSVVQWRRFAAGATILREGERGDSLFILTSGTVQVSKRLGLAIAGGAAAAAEKTLVRLTAPQFFGEMGLFEMAERSATVIAFSECKLLEISRSDFERLVESDYVLGYRVVRNIAVALCSRLRHADRDILKLTIALSLALGNR
ncbi:MAG: cyclic nucleotide-binding domain-containing protein [Chloroflexi bacterium]|nr:cyclic nucleotide-binding domain-containing protein [Chloroflexota bacterium]